MAGFLLRFLVSAFALAIAAAVVPGVRFETTGGIFIAAFFLGLLNAIVRPALVILTLPITILTLGLFLLVLNAALLGVVAALVESFHVGGLLPAVLGSMVVSGVSGLASWTIGSSGRIEVYSRRSR